jgi:hypothetical protein
MIDSEGQRFINISFQKHSREERMQFVEKELVKIRENNNLTSSSIVQIVMYICRIWMV